MADIVNLRRERKRRARDAEAAVAAEHRARFGRGKAERSLADVARQRSEQHLEGHRLIGDEQVPPAPERPDHG